MAWNSVWTRESATTGLACLSYTYSSFRGNYNGLTSSDEADGGGGRNAPNNSRAFDETYFPSTPMDNRTAASCRSIARTPSRDMPITPSMRARR